MSRKLISLRDFDWTLLMILLCICSLGVMQIYSATVNTKFAGAHLKQAGYISIGMLLMFVICMLDYHELMNHTPWIYLITMALLAVVLVVGGSISGAKRWLHLWGISFQVSEIVKLVIILLLARFFSEMHGQGVTWLEVIKVAAVVLVPAGMIALQPDLGTALTLPPIAAILLFLGGLRLRYFGIALLAGVIALPLALHHLKPYQRARITTFLNPEEDPQKSGYQILQSKIAIGSGQLWGKGVAQGTQSHLKFLPVPHTDFIFAAFAEEHGFFGALFALTLYFLLLIRLIQNAQLAPDSAGMYVIAGIASLLLFQTTVNVAMVVGYAPVTGIPLPFMSYGGSSVLFSFVAMGLVNSIRVRRFVN